MRAHTVPMKMSNRIRFTFGIVSVGPFLNGCAAIARSEYAAHTHILFRIFVKKSATFLPPKTVGRVVVVSIFQKLKVNDRSDMESRCSRSHGFHSGSLLTVLVCCDLIRCERIVLRHFFPMCHMYRPVIDDELTDQLISQPMFEVT